MADSSEASFFTPEVPTPAPERSGVIVTDIDPMAEMAAQVLAAYFNSEQWLDDQEEAFPHQRKILTDIFEELEAGYRRGYVEGPTSTGKTYLMAKLAEIFSQADWRVLMLTRTQNQADQLIGTPEKGGLARFAPSVDISTVGRHYEGNHASRKDLIVVSTYASLNNFAITDEIGDFDIILADEAHRALGKVTCKNMKEYSSDAVKLGFTATYKYHPGKTVQEIFDQAFHEMSLKEAVENDLIAPITCLVYTTDAYIPHMDDMPEFSNRELKRLITLKSRNEKVVEFAKKFIADGRQGIIGAVPGSKQAHARVLAQELDGEIVRLADGTRKFIRAKAVGSFLPPAERRQILKDYEAGYIDALTFVDLIGEGWDSAVTSFLIDTCPTTSQLRKKQRVGRVSRRKKHNLESIVVDFMDLSSGKMQITSLDVLDERSFVLGRSFSSERESAGRVLGRRSNLENMLGSEIWHNLLASDSRLLRELRLRFKDNDPRLRGPALARWEQILAREHKMPADPRNSMGLPVTAINEMARFMRGYLRTYGELPSSEELEEFIEKGKFYVAVSPNSLAQLALSGFDAEPKGLAVENLETADEENLEAEIEDRIKKDTVSKALDQLPEREARILRLRFGLEGEPRTLEDIGREFSLTRDRIRQLEQQALTRLSSLTDIQIVADDAGTPRKSREITYVSSKIQQIEDRMLNLKLKAVKAALRTQSAPGTSITDALKEAGNPQEINELKAEYYLLSILKTLYSNWPNLVTSLDSQLRKDAHHSNAPRDIEQQIRQILPSGIFMHEYREQFMKTLARKINDEMSSETIKNDLAFPQQFRFWLFRNISEATDAVKKRRLAK